jgi:hypothetical protein
VSTESQQMANAAKVMAGAARAVVEALGMQAENLKRQQQGFSIAYDLQAFIQVIEANGLETGHVIATLEGY